MIAKLKDLHLSRDGEQILIISTRADVRDLFDELQEYDVDIEIKRHREKRSNNANAMLWTFCDKIAQKIGSTKEEVYRNAVREVGVFTPLPIKNEAVETFDKIWRSKGIGWFTEVVDDSKLKGYKVIHAYHGSSTYTSEEFSRLLDNVLQDAKEVGIVVLTEAERALLLENWDK